jgi:hypothetical protein
MRGFIFSASNDARALVANERRESNNGLRFFVALMSRDIAVLALVIGQKRPRRDVVFRTKRRVNLDS